MVMMEFDGLSGVPNLEANLSGSSCRWYRRRLTHLNAVNYISGPQVRFHVHGRVRVRTSMNVNGSRVTWMDTQMVGVATAADDDDQFPAQEIPNPILIPN